MANTALVAAVTFKSTYRDPKISTKRLIQYAGLTQERETDRQTCMDTKRQKNREREREREADRQTERKTQIDRQTDR